MSAKIMHSWNLYDRTTCEATIAVLGLKMAARHERSKGLAVFGDRRSICSFSKQLPADIEIQL